MQARELFGVTLRVLGIWFLYMAGYDAVFVAVKLAGMDPISPISATVDKVFVGYYGFAALVLLVFADHIVQMIYGPNSKGGRTDGDVAPPAP